MTNDEKKVFIYSLVQDITQSIIAKVDRMPEEWNAVELRELLADRFNDERSGVFAKNTKRYRNYHATITVRNI